MQSKSGSRAARSKAGVLLALAALVTASSLAQPSKQPSVEGGPPVMRRLTEAQYRASVAEIFGQQTPIVGRFERGLRVAGLVAVGAGEAGVSAFSLEQYDASARGIAAFVVSREQRVELLPCQPEESRFDPACALRVVEHYGPLLFRRPLTREEKKTFVDDARLGYGRLGDFYRGLEFALAGMLVRPDFLLRIEHVEPDPAHRGKVRLDPYSKAARLSYFLTNAGPDRELLRAAQAGELDSVQGLSRQTERLMRSPLFEGAVRAFFEDMLRFDLFEDLAKDPLIYPAYNSTVAADAREQTLRTIVDHLLRRQGDYRDLFTTRETFLTRSLGRIHRAPVATRHGWERREFGAASGHSGILTNVSFLALHSHPGRTSPTLRGKAIREIFLCQQVPDPPPDVDFTAVDMVADNLVSPTARDRLDEHNIDPGCAACHRITDPLGLTLENFDSIGAHRTHENGALIDVSGVLDGVEFKGAQGLGQALHDHPGTPRCLVGRVYRSALGRHLTAADEAQVDEFNKMFAAANYRLPDLMRAIATSPAFYAVSAPEDASAAGQDRTQVHTRLESER